MAAILRNCLLRKFLDKKVGEFGCLRNLSTDVAKFCVIIGENGPIAYDINHFQDWDEYTKSKPMLSLIPTSGLYGRLYDPRRPYHTNDATRKILRSGSLTLDPSGEWGSNLSAGYKQLSIFMKESIWDTYSVSSASELPPQIESYFEDLEKPNLDENFMIDHPSTLPNMEYADVCLEAFWFLVKEKSAPQTEIDAVLSCIGTSHPKAYADSLTHEFLHQFLPKKLQKKFPAANYPFTGLMITSLSPLELGEVVVEVCRHTTIRCKDPHVCNLVQARLKVSTYSREEMTEVLRMVFPDCIRAAYSDLKLQKN